MEKTVDDSPYRTIKELAAYYRVSTKTVTRWIAAGHFAAYNVGSDQRPDWRLPLAEVDRWFQSRKRR